MSDLSNTLRRKFKDSEYRHTYAEQLRNSWVAAQIKALREDRGWTQAQLAAAAGMKQARISVMEDVNYESWSINTLRRLAIAFDVDLKVAFVPFASTAIDAERFSRGALEVPRFSEDPFFQDERQGLQIVFASTAATPIGKAASTGDEYEASETGDTAPSTLEQSRTAVA